MKTFPKEQQALNGERVLDLRDLRGLTQTEVARQLNVTQGFLSKVEKNEKPFPESMASELSDAFGVPRSFFAVTDSQNLGTNFTFWKRSKASVKDGKRISLLFRESSRVFGALSLANEQPTFTSHLEQILKDARAQDFADDPESMAAMLRDFVGLSAGESLRSVSKLAEKLGVGVVHVLDDRDERTDHLGISRPHSRDERPLIAVVAPTSGEELRFTLGHELAHLIFDDEKHRITSSLDPREKRAHAFSSALFVSNSEMKARVDERLPLHGYVALKADFGISIKAIIVRAHRLGLISKDRYRSLMIQYSSRGWNNHEPVEVGKERAFYYRQLLEYTFGSDIVDRTSEEMGVEASALARWIDAADEKAVGDVPDNVVSLFRAAT